MALLDRFNLPFSNKPHAAAVAAAKDLHYYLTQEAASLNHDFGFETSAEGLDKMFGVLVVENKTGEVGSVAAYSGKLVGGNGLVRFVSPVFDMLEKNSFYRKGKEEISEINLHILSLKTVQNLPGNIEKHCVCK